MTEEKKQGKLSGPHLKDLLAIRWEDIHLMHDEIENDPSTIVELSGTTLTDAGRKAWADVLDARVLRVYEDSYGQQLELTGVKASRLDEFSAMLAGYCSVEEYDQWVVQETAEQQNAQEVTL